MSSGSDSVFRVLHEDQDSLVIEKRQAFDSQANEKTGKEALFEFVSRTINKPLFPVHRLDRDVLGLMLFAKTRAAADRLSKQFRDRSLSKVYLARVLGVPKKASAQLVHYIQKNKSKNLVTVFPRESPGAKRAVLRYEVIQSSDFSSLLKVQLETGRPHQIRAQLAKHGHPILGDDRYGQKSLSKVEMTADKLPIMLISARIEYQSIEWVQVSIEREAENSLVEPKKIL